MTDSSRSDDKAAVALRILRLEEKYGFNDRGVFGGLEAFARAWAAQERAAPVTSTLSQQFARLMAGYASLSSTDRAQRVREAMRVLQSTRPVGPGPPPNAASVARPRLIGSTAEQRPVVGQSTTITPPPGGFRPSPTPTSPPRPAASAAHRKVAPPVPPLDTPVDQMHGVGGSKARLLKRLAIECVGDFLTHYPREHFQYPPPRKARDLLFQRLASFVGTLRALDVAPTSRGVKRITATLFDDTGRVSAVWFRGGFGDIKARPGDVIAVSGVLKAVGGRVEFEDPDWEPANAEPVHTRRWVPVYPLTEGVSQYWMRGQVKRVVDAWAGAAPDPLPGWVREECGLPSLAQALQQIHFPDSPELLERARRRLAFDEIFDIQLLVLQRRLRWRGPGGTALPVSTQPLEAFKSALPFALTTAQHRVLDDVLTDLARPVPMSRLLQGEVGSGKTVVAAASLLPAVADGAQGALMAPTEILAEQHYRSLTTLFNRAADALAPWLGREVRVALLTGSVSGAERKRILAGVADGSIDVLVGTQALIQEGVEFKRLAYIIVDEQHRFGVRQRVLLREKGTHPHMLVMTATPIPRTLALTLYGDLDVSTIDEMPPGRQPIETKLLEPIERVIAYDTIRSHVARGRQAFIICPLIEDNPNLEVRAATEEYRRLQEHELSGLRLALLHGRLRSQEKDQVMRAFRDGEYDVLVSTAVVEVGVDVPNATVMLIEGAERFGLSQLHQFRGRVGRGSHPAVCLLQTEQGGLEVRERLKVMEQSSSGLDLAERDLELRGPGEFFGVRQSGFPDLRMARLSDVDLIGLGRRAAQRLLADDPELSQPEHAPLRERVERLLGRGGNAG